MRRAVARGRVFPQSYSTDRRYGRLSIEAIGLYPLMWSNADDQGRLIGDPEEIKYSCCPNVDHLTKQNIPGLLQELEDNNLIMLYRTHKSDVIQMLDWWSVHYKLQWAWPSEYPPPEGWQDHLRYKKDAKTVETLNWPVSPENSGENSGENIKVTQVNDDSVSPENSGEDSPENHKDTPFKTPLLNEKEKEEEKEGGKRNSPEDSAEEPLLPESPGEVEPSLLIISPVKLLNEIKKNFRIEWGHVSAQNIDEVIPREPDAKELAQMKDLADELRRDGGCPIDYIKQAFREAIIYNKCYIEYVRKVLLTWLGYPTERQESRV